MRRFAFALSTAALVGTLLVAPAFPPAALADDSPGVAWGAAALPEAGPDASVVMGDYSADAFSAQAQTLDPQLLEAVGRDLGESPEQYLADAAAASDAGYVVDDLKSSGYAVLGSQIDGTALTVYVDSEAAAGAVEAAGGQAVIGEPPVDPSTPTAEAFGDLYGGQPYYFPYADTGYECSVGFVGKHEASGVNQFVTAGHCVTPTNAGETRYAVNSVRPNDPQPTLGAAIGTPVAGSFAFGGGKDSGLVGIGANWTPKPQILSWGGGAGAPLSGTPVSITDSRSAIVGASLCKSGAKTGWTCGKITRVDLDVTVDGQTVNEIEATTCADHGDSGGGAVTGTVAVGLTSAGSSLGCANPNFRSYFFPMVSAANKASVNSAQSWEPLVTVAIPAVTSPVSSGVVLQGGSISGTLASGSPSNRVTVTISGDSPRVATVSSNGQWSLPLTGIAPGPHSYSLTASWNNYSRSATVSGTFTVLPDSAVNRIFGDDRYATSAAIAKSAYPAHADVVYVATGENYPDALSAAPAAVNDKDGSGPLLLVSANVLPAEVSAEIASLSPQKIVVVGTENTVSAGVFNALSALSPQIVRIAGADRFETSRMLAAEAITPRSTTAYITTGLNFPDALSASAVAASEGAPVILVGGTNQSVDSATTSFIRDHGITSLVILGGPTTVTPQIESQLRGVSGVVNVTRVAGPDRFATSAMLNADSFDSSSSAYFATGSRFPDALAGAAVAGAKRAPLYVMPANCAPDYVLQGLAALGVSKVTLLGDQNALSSDVEQLNPCP